MKFEHTFMISALSAWRRRSARDAANGPGGPFHYPEDQMSDARCGIWRPNHRGKSSPLHQELPYQSLSRQTADRAQDKSVRIERHLCRRGVSADRVGKTRHHQSIGADRRRDRRDRQRPRHFLFVKVRENWGDDPDRYREMGLEFPKE
jgi:GTP-binding protein Era